MPYQSNKQCNKPGCYKIVSGTERYCVTHKHTVTYKRQYKDTDKFYSSVRWIKLRTLYLQRNPLCVHCKDEGITTAAVDVDHVTPIAQGGHPLREVNLQGLCKRHHGIKTFYENKKIKEG